MGKCLYRNERMERELLEKLHALAAKRYGENTPVDVEERIALETRHIFGNGYGTMLAAVARLAEFSAERGYPVSFRGHIGSLLLAYLLGIAANDPMGLGLRWESCLGPAGDRRPEITLNVAGELLADTRAHLGTVLPECDILPGRTPWQAIVVPKASGGYDPAREYFSLSLCPHELISLVGAARRQSGAVPRSKDLFSEELIAKAYSGYVSGIPVLGDLAGLKGIARTLKPKTFSDMVKLMGLCLSPGIRFQAEYFVSSPDPFDGFVGTREDVYDLCVRHGVGADDAFRIMEQVGKGGFCRLTGEFQGYARCQRAPGDSHGHAGRSGLSIPQGPVRGLSLLGADAAVV